MKISNTSIYSSYRDSEFEHTDNIPSHWIVKRVKDELLSLDYKRIPLSGEIREKMTDQIYDYYGASGIIDKVENYIFDETTILIGEDGANLLNRSTPLAFIATGKYWVNNHAHILKPRRGNINYFCYLLESLDYTTLISGSAQPKLTAGQLNRVLILVPSLQEQKAIADYLDSKTAQIDRQIDLLKQKADQYSQLKQSLINETVTRGLDKSVPMKDSGVEWIGEVPEHWETCRIADVAIPNKLKNTGLTEKNLLSLSYGQIIRKDFDTSFGLLPESFETYQIVKEGTIILRLTDLQNDQKSLRVGLARERGIITAAYLGLSFSRRVNPIFAYYLLNTYDLCKVFYWFGGGLRSTMRFDDVKIIPFMLPPIEEQVEIANYLDAKTVHISNIIITINKQIENLKEFRKTLISDVVTGKIKVTEEV
ncbi:restriction endonuclease subunit S [Armatimonas sp.]|uniref:restriction endonuclease subunit S n=1 Tax=Armatimonas sp. TaxID=1872638 RepID=UPI003751A4FF